MMITMLREKEQRRFAVGECSLAARRNEKKPLGFVSWEVK